MVKIGRPEASEYAPYYANYIGNVTEEDILGALEAQGRETAALLARVGEEKAAHRYGPGKWSIRQLVGHVADAERVFAYRALAIARGEATSLPSFDENAYVANANFDERSLASLVAEYEAARRSTLALLGGLSEEAWHRRGTANKVSITVRALAHIMLGHERHHVRVLRERYGIT